MKYKKPAFWITLVTVIVCVIVAVCLLTNSSENTSNEVTTSVETTTPDETSTSEEPSSIVEQETLYAYDDELVINTFGELTLEDYEELKAAFEKSGDDFNKYIKVHGTAKPHNIISSYVYYDKENLMDVAELYLYKDNVFSFNYDSVSSYFPVGLYTMDNSTLTLSTYDDLFVYVFNIIDENTIVFDASKSSEITNDSLIAGSELKSGSISDFYPPEDSADSQ